MSKYHFRWSKFVDTFGLWSGVPWLYLIGLGLILFVNVTMGVAFIVVILGIQVIWGFDEKRDTA